MQRPWKGRRLSTKRLRKVWITGLLLSATLFLWTVGLKAAGPLRTLLIDGAEIPFLYIGAVLSKRQLPEKLKTRGCILMCLAYVLIIWDASGRAPDIAEIEKSKLGKKAESTLEHLKEKTQEEIQLLQGLTKKDGNDDENAPPPPEVNHNDDTNKDNDVDGNKPKVRRRRLLSIVRHGTPSITTSLQTPLERRDEMLASDASSTKSLNVQASGSWRRLLSFEPEEKSSGSFIKDLLLDGTALRSEVGVVFVILASMLMQASRSFTRRLATDLGGSKRQFALSVSAASFSILPFALISLVSSRAAAFFSLSIGEVVTSLHLSSIGGFALIGVLWLTIPYYLRSLISTALKQKTLLQGGVIGPFIVATAASMLFGYGDRAGGLSWILVVAFVLDIAGMRIMLQQSGIRRNLSELPVDSGSANGTRTQSRR